MSIEESQIRPRLEDDPLGRQQAAFEQDGYLAIPGALSRVELAELQDATDRVWSEHRGSAALRGEPLHLLGFLGEDRGFLELVDHAAILPFVVATLGWNIYCYHCHLDVTPPLANEQPPRWEWHQDGTRQNAELAAPRPQLSVKVAYFLSDVSQPGRGNLRVIPGSHRSDTLARPQDAGIDPPGAVPVCGAPGTAVIFDRRLWHSRSDNRSRLTRKALFYAYTYRWIRPRDELRIPPAFDDAITPIRAQLLGGGTGPLGHWLPTDEDVPLRAWSAGSADH